MEVTTVNLYIYTPPKGKKGEEGKRRQIVECKKKKKLFVADENQNKAKDICW